MKRCKKLENELPDCVISYIFSKLALKDLAKTSVLSKQWYHEWGLRMDLNFDLHTIFDYNTIQDLPKTLPLFQRFHFQSEFATRLDRFMLHYQGAIIRSIRVKFPLGNEHRDAIDRLISEGIAKGAKRIELLLSSETNDETNDTTDSILPYKLSLNLLSNNDSLTYLHLQNCFLEEPLDVSAFKNLTTLVLHLVDVKPELLHSLCSNCSHLVDFTLDDCQFTSNLIIDSPTLLRLNIFDCGRGNYSPYKIDIDALNLSTFEYSAHPKCIISVTAPKLLKVFWNPAEIIEKRHLFDPIARSPHIENLAMIVTTNQIKELTKVFVRFQNLRQLELLIEGPYYPSRDYFWILDIAMASQHLEKLSLTIKNKDLDSDVHMKHSPMVKFKRQQRVYGRFFHNHLKYVELSGCVCSINVIELARHLLRSAISLKKMTFSSHDKFYTGAGRCFNDPTACKGRWRDVFVGGRWKDVCVGGCWSGEGDVIHEMLKDEVYEQCQLIIL